MTISTPARGICTVLWQSLVLSTVAPVLFYCAIRLILEISFVPFEFCKSTMTVDSPNVGVAFALVIGAGLATALGASVVFFPRLVKLASRRVLAGALGLSAGVMSYVSFVEIFGKATSSFEEGGETEERAYLYSTLCFFGGAAIMLVS